MLGKSVMKKSDSHIVLGIDPGTLVTGWGLVYRSQSQFRAIQYGIIRTKPKEPLWDRLHQIQEELSQIMTRYQAQDLAIEECFVSKNIQSALKLGHTRGVIMVAGRSLGMDIFEYAPSLIKSAVTGYGRAEKKQVSEMVKTILHLDKLPPLDAGDALAAAICHLNHCHSLGRSSGYSAGRSSGRSSGHLAGDSSFQVRTK